VIWVVVAAIAVVLFAAWMIMRRRSAAVQARSETPTAVAPPGAEPAEEGEVAGPADAAIGERLAGKGVVSGEETTPADRRKRVEAGAATVEPASPAVESAAALEAEPAVVETPVAAPAKEAPQASLRSQVEAQLEESARLLGELRESASGAEDGSTLSAGSVEIMEEGLEEIRALAARKQWGPARDKGKALHAQLTLLLQSARRGKSP
jgi:hypothetical protein